jgi:hypothetical protein
MENNINVFTASEQTALGEYTNTASQALMNGHETLKNLMEGEVIKVVNDTYSIAKSVASDVSSLKSSVLNGFNNERDLMKIDFDDVYSDPVEAWSDKQAPKISCGFDLSSLSSGLTMNVAVGDNTTLFVKEDVSQPAGIIPLVLMADKVRIRHYDKEFTSTINSFHHFVNSIMVHLIWLSK